MRNIEICPLCGNKYTDYPSLSRADNKTDICSNCGMIEALIPQTKTEFKILWNKAFCRPVSIKKALGL